MNVLVIDAEFNQPSGKTIQIGAGVYNANSGELLEKFMTYVNPNEAITPFITQLTGITDSHVNGAPTINEGYRMLRALHQKHGCFMNPIVWGSGVRNDSLAIYEEGGDAEPNFMGYRVIDVKTIFQSQQMFRNKKIKGGLKSTCEYEGIGFEGTNHDAFADAHNTFRLWFHLVKKGGRA